jgi:hypothetical protein
MENKELDTTKFVNVLTEKFVFYIGGQPREFEAGEIKVMPIYVAEHGAKHLADKILQEIHKIHNTLADTPLRRDIIASILPELALKKEIKPLTQEEKEIEIKKELYKQAAKTDELSGKFEEKDKAKDEKIASLEKKVQELIELMQPKETSKKVAKK